MEGWKYGWKDGNMDGRMKIWMEGWMDGIWMDGNNGGLRDNGDLVVRHSPIVHDAQVQIRGSTLLDHEA